MRLAGVVAGFGAVRVVVLAVGCVLAVGVEGWGGLGLGGVGLEMGVWVPVGLAFVVGLEESGVWQVEVSGVAFLVAFVFWFCRGRRTHRR